MVEAKDLSALKVDLGDGLAEILCSQPVADGYLFAVVALTSGQCAAVWECHAVVAGSLDDLVNYPDGLLNQHELTLLRYGVRR